MDEAMAAKNKRDRDELEVLRKEISRTDFEMSGLFDHRMMLARRIGELKQRLGLPVSDPAREQEIFEKAEQETDPLLWPYYREFLEKCIELSKAFQESFRKEET